MVLAMVETCAEVRWLRVSIPSVNTTTALRCGTMGLSITKSTATHHFRVLRDAGVIHQVEDGTARLNSLRREDLDARFPGLLDAVLGAAVPV